MIGERRVKDSMRRTYVCEPAFLKRLCVANRHKSARHLQFSKLVLFTLGINDAYSLDSGCWTRSLLEFVCLYLQEISFTISKISCLWARLCHRLKYTDPFCNRE